MKRHVVFSHRSASSLARLSAVGFAVALLIMGAGTAARASAALALVTYSSPHGESPVSGSWEDAEQVAGSLGGMAQVNSVSCASPQSCTAVGMYGTTLPSNEAFVVEDVSGIWESAQGLPGLASLNPNNFIDYSQLSSVSCASPGNCAAGGNYELPTSWQAFVVNEVSGTWTTPENIPGLEAINMGDYNQVTSVSCASPGNCVAVGWAFKQQSNVTQGFVVNEVSGTWESAEEVPGLGSLNAADSRVVSVSCPSAGNCAATGEYLDASGDTQGFVVDEVSGTWENVEEVPGLGSLNAGGNAAANSISCASPGNCSAVGQYADGSKANQGFVVDEASGTWEDAEEVPGLGSLNTSGNANVYSVSCASPGDCAAGGTYTAPGYRFDGFLVNEVSGTWENAEEVPGVAALHLGSGNGHYVEIASVSCGSPGNCAAVGQYSGPAPPDNEYLDGLVVDEVSGTWENAEELPWPFSAGEQVGVTAVSCASPGNCAAVGSYYFGEPQGFVTLETPWHFSGPDALALYGGDVFAANYAGNTLIEVSASTGNIVHVISSSSYKLDGPDALKLYDGDLFVANALGNSLTEVDASTGQLVRVISGSSYGLDDPDALALYNGDLFVASQAGGGVRGYSGSISEINTSTGKLIRVIKGAAYRFLGISAFALRDNNLFAASANKITEIGAFTGKLVRVIAGPRYGFHGIRALALSGDDLFAADYNSSGLTEVSTSTGNLVRKIGSFPNFDGPSALAVGSSDLFAANAENNSITEVTISAGKLVQVISGSSYKFDLPDALALDGGALFVANSGGNSLSEVSASSGALVRVMSGSP